MIRHRREMVVAWGFRYLLVGAGMGLAFGASLLVLVSDLASGRIQKGVVPVLAIFTFCGAVVGGASGVVGGLSYIRLKHNAPKKTATDELSR
jgi:hypothetical protein